MKIIDTLNKKEKGISFEFFPPKTEKGRKKLEETIKGLKPYKPLYISMTYGAGGGSQERTKSLVSSILKNHPQIEVMPHLTCIGANFTQIKKMLDEYQAWGIDNIMALRGDIPQEAEQENSNPFKDFSCAYDLVKFIKEKKDLCISAAVYPEGHTEAESFEADLNYTKAKIEAGVDFGVTQMFFDNNYYYDFIQKARAKNINIPLLPGILPLTNLDNVTRFCSGCGATIPLKIRKALEKFRGSRQDMRKAGLDITINQCRDLIDNGFSQIHLFSLNKLKTTKTILEALNL